MDYPEGDHTLPIRLMRWEKEPLISRGLKMLCDYLRKRMGDGPLVMWEIGTYAGEGAEIFSPFFTEVHCVDTWNFPLSGEAEQYSWEEVERSWDMRAEACKNLVKHKGWSTDVAKTIAEDSIDFIYIDADHEYTSVRKDIAAWFPKVKNLGWIGGHDFSYFHEGVPRAVHDSFTFAPGSYPLIFADTSWLLQKNTALSASAPAADSESLQPS
jgi:Methyltransferase domain